jgi:bifunctional non-homologous end joining protein LigD
VGLQKYRDKRDFSQTPEPRGKAAPARERLGFVVQKHAASHLHYDFRLELDGVLKSWAVPKGPSLDPSVKRLAIEVEDHPLEYGGFEGTIPPRQYGAGTVLLWDRGTWTPVGDPHEGYRKGRLKFSLAGEKLRGQWTLARIGGRGAKSGTPGAKNQWLLIKSRDEYARSGEDAEITALRGESVLSGRTIEEIGKPAKPREAAKPDPARIPGARKAPLPSMIEPQLATLVERAPEDDARWLFEAKYDGFRMLARVKDGKARFFTRNAKEWTAKLAPQAEAVAGLPVAQAWFDGEVVVFDERGVSSFQALQNAFGTPGGARKIVYCLFDLVYLDGCDLRGSPLVERKALLERLLRGAPAAVLRYSEHIEGRGAEFHRQACSRGLEGIIGKLRDAPYLGTRSAAWIKVKCRREQEFVIGGYTDPEGSREAFGALLIGVWEGSALKYAGRVGTGFNDKLLRDLHARLEKLQQDKPPFANPPRGANARGVHWVKPELVAQVKFAEWTGDGMVRQAAFQGLREDKAAKDVVREEEVAAPGAGAAKASVKPARAAALNAAGAKSSVSKYAASRSSAPSVAGVTLTHPERVLYPDQGVTKLELARYYEAVEEWILPHLEARPLTLVRCPAGHERTCFYQKHLKDAAPPGVDQVEIREGKGLALYPLVKDAAGLVALVQMGVLEFHTWQSRADQLERPDRMIFDLDPAPEVAWIRVVEAAQLVRGLLKELGLRSFLKTTGGKGLHVVAPLLRRQGWDEVKGFSEAVAQHLARELPDRFTAKLMKRERTDRIFIDYLRNGRGATAIAAFSTRARPGATVSAPISWDELSVELRSDQFNVRSMVQRLAKLREDPWKDYASTRQCITAAMKRKLGFEG